MRCRGFTLVELIIVISLLSIISLVTVGFISSSMQGFADLQRRDQLSAAARVAVERMAREVRNALPNSIRVTADNNCIEFIPAVAASRYISVPIAASGALAASAAASSFEAVAFAVRPSFNNGRIAVYPIDSNDSDGGHNGNNPIYQQDPHGILSSIIQSTSSALAPTPTPASGTVTVTLNSDHTFPADSPSNRFFIVEDPVSFCLIGRDLYRFQGADGSLYSYSSAQQDGATLSRDLSEPNEALLASELLSPPGSRPFRYIDSVLQRNGIVLFDLLVEDSVSGENIQVQFDVQVRNVP